MGIFERAHSVIASNFNSLMGRFEEPGRDVAWLLSEMKEQIHAAERELIRVMGSKKRSESELSDVDQQIRIWEDRAALAVKHQQDSLAREALAMKQRLVKKRETLVQLRSEQQQAAIAMRSEIDRMRRAHRDYDARKSTIGVQVAQARGGGGVKGLGASPDASPFDDFERVEANVERAEAEASAVSEVEQLLDKTPLGTMSNRELEAQFENLELKSAQDSSRDAEASDTAVSGAGGNPRIRIEP